MDDSISLTLEKIRHLEQEKEAKLKEKAEIETRIASLKRTIQNTQASIEHLKREQLEIVKSTKKVCSELELERIRRDALLAQIKHSRKEFEELRVKTDEGIANVWEQRSFLCSHIQNTSDNYDIWALLTKPLLMEPLSPIKTHSTEVDCGLELEEKIKEMSEKRDRALAERDKLLVESDTGEEFVRIKNALKYSMEKLANFHHR